MKKTIISLAVLTIAAAASLLTSCNKAEIEQLPSDNVVTITIATPETDLTKVVTSVDDGTNPISITGWALGDVIDLYKLGTADDVYTKVVFTCTNPSTSTFSGTLPAGVTLEDLTFAVYNATIDYYYYNADPAQCYFRLLPNVMAATDVKDVVIMTAVKSSGSFQMKLINNVVKFYNGAVSDIDGAWKEDNGFGKAYLTKMCVRNYYNGKLSFEQTSAPINDTNFESGKITLKAGSANYLFMFPGSSETIPNQIGLSRKTDAVSETSLIGFKNYSALSSTGSKIYKAPGIPDGALCGLFSIDASNKILFSKGNLWWNGTAFKFETNQYDFATTWGTSHASHFYWSKDESVACSLAYPDTIVMADTDILFTNNSPNTPNPSFSVEGNAGVWRVLSDDEWNWLLEGRTVNGGTGKDYSYKNCMSGVSIDSKTYYGVLLYPDNYSGSYAETTWSAITAAGIVFLPASGTHYSGTVISNIGTSGFVWGADLYDVDSSFVFGSAYGVIFYSSTVESNVEVTDNGRSIRLVTDAK